MAGISGQGTTFNLPNYVGELFGTSPQDTPFLSAIGGLTGGESAESTVFTWQEYDLRASATNRQRLEGAAAPTAEGRSRAVVRNVVEIHQEALDISYTKLAAVGQIATNGSSHPYAEGSLGANPVMNELDWQVAQQIKQVARDVEDTFINGTFQEPSDNNTPRKTRGLLEAITTNVLSAGGVLLSENDGDMILDLMQSVWAAGGISEDATATLMCNGFQKRQLTKSFVKQGGYQQNSRTVGGVKVDTIITDFGTLNVMLNRYVPADTVIVASLEMCAPKFLPIPNKGHFFLEPLAQTGASVKCQLYGEIGLAYGNEKAHGYLDGLATSDGSS